ncbi:MAG: polysaccharide deacetylase family protein [Bacillota bacterium]
MKNNILRIIIFALLLLFIAQTYMLNMSSANNTLIEINGKGCIVLCYHRVLPENRFTSFVYKLLKIFTNDNELKLYSVTGSDFEKQLKCLEDHKVKILSLEELEYHIYNKIDLPDKSAVITFDDVDESVYKNAYPILKRYNVPFSLFVITGQVGNKDFKGLRLSTWDQIKDMYSSGLVSLGLHTHNYHYLDKENNPPFMDPKNSYKFYEDTTLAIKTMEENMGITPRYFSYPYGFGIPETDEYLLKSNIRLLFSLKPGVVTKDDPVFFIKRILVDDENWASIQDWIENKE